jgi:transcriptional regulator with XRE-family HTH domain
MDNSLTVKERAKAINTLVGKRIRLFRHERGLSQDQVGGHLGITFQQVQKYERGFNRTSAGVLQNLADLYEVAVADFFAPANSNDLRPSSRGELETIRALRKIKSESSIKHLRDTVKFLADLEG